MDTLVALCALGAEHTLGNEIKHLGFHLCSSLGRGTPGRVAFLGDAMTANLALRTADRVLLLVAQGRAETFDDLFDCVYQVDWEELFHKDCRVCVNKVRTHNSMLMSARSVQAITHKAIYSKLSDKWHIKTLPETGAEHNVRVYIDDDECTVLLDTSGEPLHKRGYREAGGSAPLRETIAAVMLQEALWRRKTPLLDPFCGSGTIAAEAFLYAYDVAPGLLRQSPFALETLKGFDAEAFALVKRQMAQAIRTDVMVRIAASDIDKNAVRIAQENIERAMRLTEAALRIAERNEPKGSLPCIDVTVKDALLCGPPESGWSAPLILTNPPYGKRLGTEEDAEELYRKMAVMRQNFPDASFGVITEEEGFPRFFGREAAKAKRLVAGNLERTLFLFPNRAVH